MTYYRTTPVDVSGRDGGAWGHHVKNDAFAKYKSGSDWGPAFQAAHDAAVADGTKRVLCDGATYSIATQLDWERDVLLEGTHVPGTDPTNAPTGTTLLRAADIIMFNLVGTNRITDRVGRNLFRSIQFKDDTNLSAKAWFNTKYADSLVFEHVTFWQPDGQTTAGHCIYAEECWDWRFLNVVFKHYGTAAGKAAIYCYNGDDDSTNGWQLFAVRFQEGAGYGMVFDSSGGGSNNNGFDFFGCKMEDTGNGSLHHLSGVCTDLRYMGGYLAGCGEQQVSMPSDASRWTFAQVEVTGGGATATEMMELIGNRHTVRDCTFSIPGASVAQYVNTTGAEGEITGNTRVDTSIPLVNSSGVATTTHVHHNRNFLTEYGGSTTIPDTSDHVTITHSLDYTPSPQDISVCFTGPPNNGITSLVVTNIGATTFDVYAYAAGTATTPSSAINIAWSAQRIRG